MLQRRFRVVAEFVGGLWVTGLRLGGSTLQCILQDDVKVKARRSG
jgi:hypothetical protein